MQCGVCGCLQPGGPNFSAFLPVESHPVLFCAAQLGCLDLCLSSEDYFTAMQCLTGNLSEPTRPPAPLLPPCTTQLSPAEETRTTRVIVDARAGNGTAAVATSAASAPTLLMSVEASTLQLWLCGSQQRSQPFGVIKVLCMLSACFMPFHWCFTVPNDDIFHDIFAAC